MIDKDGMVESHAFNVTQLMTLSAVAQHGSFTRAAEALGVTQPSVSQQIREIEHTAGMPVVQQKGRSIALTPLGLDLAEIGRRIAVERTLAARAAARHEEGAEGRLMVGASMTTSAFVLPRIVSRLQRERPDAIIEVRTANSFDVVQMVTDDIVDIGVIEWNVKRPELIVTPFTKDCLVCIVSAKHTLKGEDLRPDDVRNETLLMREDGSGTRQVLLHTLASQGFHFKRTILFGTNETVRNAVRYGLGIAWQSRISLEAELKLGLIRELTFSTPPIERQFSFVRRRDTTPTPLGEVFITALKR